MSSDKTQMTKEEILKQLPDDIANRQFTSFPGDTYTSVWERESPSTFSIVWSKFKQNPFIPLGLGGTVYFLTRGIMNMGNRELSQKMMRGRVMAQGFTVLALIAGVSLEAMRKESKDE